MSGRVELVNGMPIYIPNDVYELEEKGCYISYNSSEAVYGSKTTALVRDNGIQPIKFLILNGDHRKEYSKLKHYGDCVEYFKSHLEQKNKLSENWDEEIIVDSNGKYRIQKIVNQQ